MVCNLLAVWVSLLQHAGPTLTDELQHLCAQGGRLSPDCAQPLMRLVYHLQHMRHHPDPRSESTVAFTSKLTLDVAKVCVGGWVVMGGAAVPGLGRRPAGSCRCALAPIHG